MTSLGFVSSHGFGDCTFNLPLIEAFCEKHNCKATVATMSKCKDAFYNVPFIDNIIEIPSMHHGVKALRDAGVDRIFQITQNINFPIYKSEDPNHSLAATSWVYAKTFGIEFDPRPKIFLTEKELLVGQETAGTGSVALETEYYSGQSWSGECDFREIVERNPEKRFLWLSLKKPSFHAENLVYLGKELTRRECIATIKFCESFVCAGSGMFCASRSFENPPKTFALWIDNYYRYKDTMKANGWDKNLTWVDSRLELLGKVKL